MQDLLLYAVSMQTLKLLLSAKEVHLLCSVVHHC